MTYIVTRMKMGKAMRAVAQDQDAARLVGINVNGTISFTFALGGALAGAAGVLYFLVQAQTYYDTGTQFGLIAFTAAVLGGIGNLTGAVVGGLAIGLIQSINEGGTHGLGSHPPWAGVGAPATRRRSGTSSSASSWCCPGRR